MTDKLNGIIKRNTLIIRGQLKAKSNEQIKDMAYAKLPTFNTSALKTQDNGKRINATLKGHLTRSLRSAMSKGNTNEEKIALMQEATQKLFKTYKSHHTKLIAVTEVRSASDNAKHEYAKEFKKRNPSFSTTKVWVHNNHLVRTPRSGHLALNGIEIDFESTWNMRAENGQVIKVRFPHDSMLPPNESIGCQCTWILKIVNRFGKKRERIV